MEMNVLLSDMIEFVPPTVGVIVAALIAAFLLFVSGFASGSEIAFFSLSPSDINELEEEKSEEDKQIRMLREDSERTLATCQRHDNHALQLCLWLGCEVQGGVA